MEYVKFGNAGLTVSRLCWGAMNFYEREDEAAAGVMVQQALDAGINFFDTADAYGEGRSEEVLGKALSHVRDHVVIATKLWVPMYRHDKNGRGCGRYHMVRAVEDSLRRLGTDRIDLYQLHHPDIGAPVEETLSTAHRLIDQGKIRYFGVSNHYAWQMAHMLGVSARHDWEPLVSLQCHYNLLNRAVENETMNFCKRFNVAAITYGPLSGGVFSGHIKRGQPLMEGSRVQRMGLHRIVKSPPGRTPDEVATMVYDLLDEMEIIASRNNVSVNQLALKWVLSRDWVTCPILGGSRAEHFNPMYKLFELEIDPADLEHLTKLTEAQKFVPFENQAMRTGAATQSNWW